jgi:hypothetical protein
MILSAKARVRNLKSNPELAAEDPLSLFIVHHSDFII